MKFSKLFFLFSFVPFMLFSDCHYEAFVDLYFSPYMGSEWLITLNKSIEKKEDALIKPTEPPRRGVMPVLGRAFELALFWNPLNTAMDVVQHEVFGHGYRVRSIKGAHVRKYQIDWPMPYGKGGGATIWIPSDKTTVGQFQAVTIAGLEAENILARQLKLKWLTDRRIDPRQGMLYEKAQLSPLFYSCVPADTSDFFSSHDILSYLNVLCALYPEDCLKMKELRRAVALNILDPMVFYEVAASWYYIFTGKSLWIPMIKTGEISWLPNISVQLAPYGLEYYLENYLLYKERPIYTYLKGGKHSGMSYFGCGIHYDEVIMQGNFSVGLRFDSWYQPNFLVNWTFVDLVDWQRPSHTFAASLKRKWGAAASIVSRLRINDTLTFFYSDLGFKTAGYLPGFPLQRSPTIRLGISAEF